MTTTTTPRPVDDLGPVWAEHTTSWRQDDAGAWHRTFVGNYDGALVRQSQTWDGRWSQFSDHEVLQRGTGCPSWCTAHLGEDYSGPMMEGTLHRHRIVVDDVGVVIEEMTGSTCSTDPAGPVVHPDNVEWVSEGTIRNLAAALLTAADLIDGREPQDWAGLTAWFQQTADQQRDEAERPSGAVTHQHYGLAMAARIQAAGLRRRDVERALNCSPATLRRKLAGKSPIYLTDLAALAELAGTDPLTLVDEAHAIAGVEAS